MSSETKHAHFILIRFSLKLKTGFYKPIKNWSKKRLDYRFFLFENICLPSIIGQKTKKNLHIIILISPDFPEEYKNKLHNLVKNYKYIHIVPWKKSKFRFGRTSFLKKYCPPGTEIIATTRLDDDDGLHPNFTNLVFDYCQKKPYKDFFLSFIKGCYLNLDRSSKKYYTCQILITLLRVV